ncbi:type II secretion system F family protein [Streptomonospora nanhaiensis]|uniref:Tight adherence protein B n=1 Tax=Streptomonospora nanhaiensis TaxID=1323731 RepID=A0A853BM62_9ACTN|nr:type II secretion system F family protein [Streptomonospora nanhaiensis]MBV2363234.1 type II secretion system F family protein [Streptomonospora nanhaiensis]NYI95592.1 tight adherence protein B [Streptomonospora nanhaiensis]
MTYTVIILGLSLVTISVFIWGLVVYIDGTVQRRQLASRSALHEVERRANTPLARLDVVLRRTEPGRRIEYRLARAGVKVKVSTFVLLLVGAAALAIVFVWQALAPVFGLAAAVGVGFIFFAYLKRQEERRKEEFTAQLPELARVLSNATQAGLALPTAIDMAAEELDDPAGSELRRAAESMKLGQPFDEAMRELRERMPSREIGVLISTLLVSARSGGALVSALRSIAETLEERKESRREVHTILTETTSTAWALLAMGVGALFLVNMLQPDAIRTMTESPAGTVVLALSCGLFLTGFLLVRRITTKIDF